MDYKTSLAISLYKEMYQKIGFEIVHENRDEYIMICRL